MTSGGVDTAYLRYQYEDAEKLRVRMDTHARHSERTQDTFASWLLAHVDAAGGDAVLDVGCGPGVYHHALLESGARVAGLDASRGMLREVLASGAGVGVAQADAERLPCRDAAFDRVMANHMLYHVPDQRAALAEFRRVLKPGGRVVMATNGAENFTELLELHRTAADRAGYTPSPNEALRFTLDDLPLVRTAFPSAEVFVRDDAFVFHEPGPVLRFYASGNVDAIEDRPSDGSHRAPLLREMETLVEAIIARQEVFRVSKIAGCYVADV